MRARSRSEPSRIVLASGSPRRRDLLGRLGLPFLVQAPGVPEEARPGEGPRALVLRLALAKAGRVSGARPRDLVIAADTVAVHGGEVLGKPQGPAEARAILRRLEGSTHEVLTGLCVTWRAGGFQRTCVEGSIVRMEPLGEDEIEAYLATGEPLGKAGAYALQGAAGRFLRVVRGSRTNVVGLPLEALGRLLKGIPGIAARRAPGAGPGRGPPFFP